MTQIPLNTVPQDFIEPGTSRVSLSALKFLQFILRRVNLRDAEVGAYVYTPVNGDVLTINLTNTFLYLNPVGSLTSLTVNFPENPQEGTGVVLKTSQSISGLVLVPATPATILDTITTLAANGYVKYTYILSEQLWVKTSS